MISFYGGLASIFRQSTYSAHAVSSGFVFIQAEDGIRDIDVTGVQTCALPISVQQHERRTFARGTIADRQALDFNVLLLNVHASCPTSFLARVAPLLDRKSVV